MSRVDDEAAQSVFCILQLRNRGEFNPSGHVIVTEDTIDEGVLTDVTSFHAVGQGASKSVSGKTETDTQRGQKSEKGSLAYQNRQLSVHFPNRRRRGDAIFTFCCYC